MSAAERTEAFLERHRVVMVVRSASADDARRAIAAAVSGGIRIVEVTMTVPGAPAVIAWVRETYGDEVCVGAGTVLSIEQLRECAGAGAEYIVSPGTVPEVVRETLALGLAALPGAMTPTEVWQATDLGAAMVKVFPARTVGREFISDLLGPHPQLKLVPSGGVAVHEASDWLAAGAFAVSIGGALSPMTVGPEQERDITERAAEITAAITRWIASNNKGADHDSEQ